VVQSEALSFLSAQREQYHLIFLDPPYRTDLLENSLKKITEIDMLSENGIIICESPADKVLPELPQPYQKGREYRYGKIKITVYRKEV
jgi:16S rRNA G966 N2-methylase RsmD